MRACGYGRIGKDRPVEELPLAEELAAEQGIRIHRWFVDEGVDGTVLLEDRPEGQDLLSCLRDGVYQTVVVLSLDRLGRTPSALQEALEAVTEAGGHVRVLTTRT